MTAIHLQQTFLLYLTLRIFQSPICLLFPSLICFDARYASIKKSTATFDRTPEIALLSPSFAIIPLLP